jgi:phosphatidylglycerol lysyltransferase
MNWRRLVRWMAPLLVLGVLAVASTVLRRELSAFRYHDVMQRAQAIPLHSLSFAVALTLLAYAVLPGYDVLGLRYIGARLPFAKVAFGSVIAYGLSQTLGLPLLTGASVRFRLWSAWGLSSAEIARAASFTSATFALGLVLVTGTALSLEPASFGEVVGVHLTLLRPVGVACLGLVGAYVLWSASRRVPIRIREWEFPVPPVRLAVAQLLVASLDWVLAGAVLFVLLPPGHGILFWPFLGAFLLAQVAGILSHVPGGVGVFETAMVLLLRPELPADVSLGALLVFRAVYYLFPFAVAVVLLAASEAARHRERVVAFATSSASMATRLIPTLLPHALSASTFAGGVILLVSGATPSARGRVAALDGALPLGIIELSHFLASLAGAGLIVLAWAIRRRLDAAYVLTVALLGVGIITSLLKGLDWEEATVLAMVLTIIIPSRGVFYRKAALMSEPLEPGWIVAVVTVLGAATWLGMFSYKHIEFSNELFWQFTRHGDAPRFLRATAGTVGALFVFGVARLLRHARGSAAPPTESDLERAAEIGRASGSAVANVALVGDKALLFSEKRNAFLMYGVEGRSWVALGDPLGPKDERVELVWRFRELADQHGGWTVFYEIGTENLPIYLELGLTALKIGEEAVVDLTTFSLEGNNRKGLRRTHRSVGKEGAVFEVVLPDRLVPSLPELTSISNVWLSEKKTREKGFSLGRFDEAYIRRSPVAVVRVNGRIVAFANLWLGGNVELSIDLMRARPDAPAGVMDFLFIEVMLWGMARGYQRFLLGMAPLSGLESRQLAPMWIKLGSMLYRHGEQFYNFRGLRQYKEKFDPVWEPRYLASPGGWALPRILTNVAALISGGLRGVIAK